MDEKMKKILTIKRFQKGEKDVRVFFQAPPDMVKVLDVVAEQNDISRSEVIRKCIENTLKLTVSEEIELPKRKNQQEN